MGGRHTAAIVDEWPLVRLGMSHALRSSGVRVVVESGTGDDGVRRALSAGVSFLIVGAVRDAALADLVRLATRALPAPKIVVLVEQLSRDELIELAEHGVDAVLLRSASPDELGATLDKVAGGERVVAPALVPLLVGVVGPVDGQAVAVEQSSLTRKELEVLARLAEGLSNREIADVLYVTPATVKTHLAHIYGKLGVTSRQEALARAVALGLLG